MNPIAFSKPHLTDEDYAAWNSGLSWIDGCPGRDYQEPILGFRDDIAARLGLRGQDVLPTNSCTAALFTAITHLRGPRKVACPIYTWFSTYSTVLPSARRMIDCTAERNRPFDLCIDDVPRGSLVVWPELFGYPITDTIICSLRRKECLIILDSAQNLFYSRHGAWIKNDSVDAICYSFYVTKQLTTIRGGALVMRNAMTLYPFIDSGSRGRERAQLVGHNLEMGEPNALLGRSQLRHLEQMELAREGVRSHYWSAFQNNLLGKGTHLALLRAPDVYTAEAIRTAFRSRNIAVGYHYCIPREYRRSAAADLAACCVTLPLHADLSLEDVTRVIRVVKMVF